MPRRILTLELDVWVDPQRLFELLNASATNIVWLDSGIAASSGFSYLGIGTRIVSVEPGEDLAGVLGSELDNGVVDSAAVPGTFRLGWVGWLSYEYGANRLGVEMPDDRGGRFLFLDRAIAIDHNTGSLHLLVLDDAPGAPEWLADTGDWVVAVASAAVPAAAEAVASAVVSAATESIAVTESIALTKSERLVAVRRHSDTEYLALVERCQEFIRRGDAYQLCLTNRLDIVTATEPHAVPDIDSAAVYARIRSTNPSHHAGFLRLGDTTLLSASPEQFLRVSTDRVVSTKPIKGTRPRGRDRESDDALQAELVGSDKERAENLMIVDLMRNDLTKIAELGSVAVTSLLSVESYATVHQLVSTVRATLRSDCGPLDAIEATFPAGSMTGAPKVSAVRILSELEDGARGIYSGVFGYLGLDGAVDLAMVIRSIVVSPDGVSVGTGGGITTLSIPAEEVEETRIKAAPLLSALGVADDSRA